MIKNLRYPPHDFLSMREIMRRVVVKNFPLMTFSAITDPSLHKIEEAMDVVSSPSLEEQITDQHGEMISRKFVFGYYHFDSHKSGKVKRVSVPHPILQRFFVRIRQFLEVRIKPHPNMYGYVKGRNCKQAITSLLDKKGKRYFFSFDIQAAFESVTQEMILQALSPVLSEFPKVAIEQLSRLLTIPNEGTTSLPRGSSCSPILLNLVLFPICEEIDKVCRENEIAWCVYADDFSFASRARISNKVKTLLMDIPAKYGLKVNPEKTKDNLGKTIAHGLGLTISISSNEIHIKREAKKAFRRKLYAEKKFKAYGEDVIVGMELYIKHIYGHVPRWFSGI